jgi:hypothetical protein
MEVTQEQPISIKTLSNGDILTAIDAAIQNIIVPDILDDDAKATAKRELTVKLIFQPDEERYNAMLAFQINSKLAVREPGVAHLAFTNGKGVEVARQNELWAEDNLKQLKTGESE